MSGIVGLNVLIELRKQGSGKAKLCDGNLDRSPAGSGNGERCRAFSSTNPAWASPTSPIVTLSDGAASSNLLVLEGDMRNALPVGQKVEVTFRKESGHNVLVDVDYP